MTATQQKTAAMVAIGDELLSGRTRDANIHFLAGWLTERGVALSEVRIVLDEEADIVAAINALRPKYDYVFTSGGIGPTHDDITADAVARTFGVPIGERADALKVLGDWYAARGEEITDARRRMARIPTGAALIPNTVSGAPGFRMENVFTMAGVPKIFEAMLDAVDAEIERGPVRHAVTVRGHARESQLADGLRALQTAIKGLSIGSYPGRKGDGSDGVAIVLRSTDEALLGDAAKAVASLFASIGVTAETLPGAHAVD